MMASKKSSARISSIAAELMHITGKQILAGFDSVQADEFAAKVRSLAASVLSQDERKGQDDA